MLYIEYYFILFLSYFVDVFMQISYCGFYRFNVRSEKKKYGWSWTGVNKKRKNSISLLKMHSNVN
jgi:hypothetical protein